MAVSRHNSWPSVTLGLLPPDGSSGEERKDSENGPHDHGSGNQPIGLAPGDPRSGSGEHEDGSERAQQQRADVRTKPPPASLCLLDG